MRENFNQKISLLYMWFYYIIKKRWQSNQKRKRNKKIKKVKEV